MTSTTTSACVTGCTQRDQHRAECTGRCQGCRRSVELPHARKCDDAAREAAKGRATVPVGAELDAFRPPCTRCLPRAAQVGRLCAWCAQRFTSDVATAPALVRHLRVIAHPTAAAAPPSEGQAYTDPAEASILSGAVTAADDLHALLATFAQEWVDAHPGSDGPDARWARKTHQTVRGNEYGQWVRRPDVAGLHVTGATDALVRWLTPHLGWVFEQAWAGEARTELASLTANLHNRWPIEDAKERQVEGVPCPRCDHLTLTYSPPSWFMAPFKVACQNPECGRVFSEDEWERFVALNTGHRPVSDGRTATAAPEPAWERPAPPSREPGRVFDFRGISVVDGPVGACPACHLTGPCDCEAAS